MNNCASCHRYNATGEKVFKSAPLVFFPDWYLKSQIEKFKSGIRGHHPKDLRGKKMVETLSFLDEDINIDNIIAYITSLELK
jgi:cytochrome c553